MIPSVTLKDAKLEIDDGSLSLIGNFLDFTTESIDKDGNSIKRFYKGYRMDIKIPCEHSKDRNGCDMEI